MKELTNADRAARARKALSRYNGDNDAIANAVDLLTDLRHYYHIQHARDITHPTFDETLESSRTHFEAELEPTITASNKRVIFTALKEANITSIKADFDGEGDSGGLTNIIAYRDDAVLDFPAVQVTIHDVRWGAKKSTEVTLQLREAVEQLCYDCLEDKHAGWENNDGAFGEFDFNVEKQTIELVFNARFTDTHTTTYGF
jgi:hypothetical protein